MLSSTGPNDVIVARGGDDKIDGGAEVQTALVRAGTRAARLKSTATTGAAAPRALPVDRHQAAAQARPTWLSSPRAESQMSRGSKLIVASMVSGRYVARRLLAGELPVHAEGARHARLHSTLLR